MFFKMIFEDESFKIKVIFFQMIFSGDLLEDAF